MADEVTGEEPGAGHGPEQGEAAPTPVEASVQQDILAAMSQAEDAEAESPQKDAAPEAEKSG